MLYTIKRKVILFCVLLVSSVGTVTYSEVRTFLKKQPNIMTQYMSILTMNATLAVTGNHLIYSRKTYAEELIPRHVTPSIKCNFSYNASFSFKNIIMNIFRYADKICIGDEVLVHESNVLVPQKVMNITKTVMQGNSFFLSFKIWYTVCFWKIGMSNLPVISFHYKIFFCVPGAYVPLTEEGKILVDRVLASCYADFNHHLAHLTMAPMQIFSVVLEWLVGNDTGFPVYVSIARQLGLLMLSDGHFWSY